MPGQMQAMPTTTPQSPHRLHPPTTTPLPRILFRLWSFAEARTLLLLLPHIRSGGSRQTCGNLTMKGSSLGAVRRRNPDWIAAGSTRKGPPCLSGASRRGTSPERRRISSSVGRPISLDPAASNCRGHPRGNEQSSDRSFCLPMVESSHRAGSVISDESFVILLACAAWRDSASHVVSCSCIYAP